jgi:hypothetical protein
MEGMLAALALLVAAGSHAPRLAQNPRERPTVALVPLRALGVPAELTHALQMTLRNELAALPEARLLPEKDVAEALQREPDCEARVACALAAAAKLGARQLISGTASQLGKDYIIDLKLLDARTGQELRRASHPVSGSPDVLIDTVRATAVELLAPQRYVGALRVDVPGVAGALLFVDGKPVGETPMGKPIEGLAPGQHTLRVTDRGLRELSAFVDIHFGQTTEARFELGSMPVRSVPIAALPVTNAVTPRSRPWMRPAAYTGLGLGLVSAGVAIFFHAKSYATASNLNRKEANNTLSASDLPDYASIDHDVKMARGFYVAAAVLGLAGGGLFLWDANAFGIQGKF